MFAGVVLAAGRSSRMGAPKALLELSGLSFLERILDALAGGGCDPVLVVTGPASLPGATEIAAVAAAAGAGVAINPDPSSEQVESLRIAIRSLPDGVDGIVVTPVDSPGIVAATVSAIIAGAEGGAPIVVPTSGGRRGHPILFAGATLEELFEPLPEGARTLVRRHASEVVEVPVEGAEIHLDVDTPEDYRRLRDSSG